MHFALLSPFGLTGKRFPCAVSNGSARFVARTPRSTRNNIYQHCTRAAVLLLLLNTARRANKLETFESKTFSLPARLCLFTSPSFPPPFSAVFVALSPFYLLLLSSIPFFTLLSSSSPFYFAPSSPACLFWRCLSAPAYWRHSGPRWAPNEFHFTDATRARNFICCQTEFAAIAPLAKVKPSTRPPSL